ncbi:hypothetical protein [Microvirga sp. TS319]|uniref:hypothetical protein n=1 Tax=Microvirga sp. TS319 TaxID=3241165 RepID=UPI00351A438D
MTNEKMRLFADADDGLPLHHAWYLDSAGNVAGERDRLASAIPFEIATTPQGGNSGGASVRHILPFSKKPAVDRLRELRDPHEEAAPLPQWMSATRPSRAGMFIPGVLTALAVLAVANGILSTVLELVWL